VTATRPLRVVARKWPDRPHWEYDAVLLGEDDLGVWVGAPVGTAMARPGAAFRTDQAQVSLVPRDDAFVATFYARGGSAHCDVYVDITTVPVWSDDAVTAVDLDLDVVRGWTGRTWVDDEDEFAAHRNEHGYPPHLVHLAVTSCHTVHEAMTSRRAPYDGLHPRTWFETLDALVARP
jgi:hypothetical protein